MIKSVRLPWDVPFWAYKPYRPKQQRDALPPPGAITPELAPCFWSRTATKLPAFASTIFAWCRESYHGPLAKVLSTKPVQFVGGLGVWRVDPASYAGACHRSARLHIESGFGAQRPVAILL